MKNRILALFLVTLISLFSFSLNAFADSISGITDVSGKKYTAKGTYPASQPDKDSLQTLLYDYSTSTDDIDSSVVLALRNQPCIIGKRILSDTQWVIQIYWFDVEDSVIFFFRSSTKTLFKVSLTGSSVSYSYSRMSLTITYTDSGDGTYLIQNYNISSSGTATTKISSATGTNFSSSIDDIYYSDFDIYDYDDQDKLLKESDSLPYDGSITYDSDTSSYEFNVTCNENDFSYRVALYLSYNGSSYQLTDSDSYYSLTGTDFSHSLSREDLLSWWKSLAAFDSDVTDGTLKMVVTPGYGSDPMQVFTLDTSTLYAVDPDDPDEDGGFFSQKKDYYDFPDISDYVNLDDFPDIRDYVSFTRWSDMDFVEVDGLDAVLDVLKNVWTLVKTLVQFMFLDLLSGAAKWLWACLKYIFVNLVGLFEWLGACFTTFIKNIGVALYNLCVDVKSLFIKLFVPSSSKLKSIIEEKFPIYYQFQHIFASLENGTSTVTFTFLGGDASNAFVPVEGQSNNITLSLASKVSAYFASACYSFSTVCIDVFTAIKIYDLVLSCFGITMRSTVHSSDDDSSSGSTDLMVV